MKICLTLILAILAFNSFGCDCYSSNLDSLMKYADYVVIGKVIRNVSPDSVFSDSLDKNGNGSTVEFKVNKTLKGSITNDIIIIDQRGATNCTYRFNLGSEYLVFGYDHMMFPTTPTERNAEYLIDEMISGVSEEEIEEKTKNIESFFNELRQKKMYTYTDGCNIYDPKSNQYEKSKKYRR